MKNALSNLSASGGELLGNEFTCEVILDAVRNSDLLLASGIDEMRSSLAFLYPTLNLCQFEDLLRCHDVISNAGDHNENRPIRRDHNGGHRNHLPSCNHHARNHQPRESRSNRWGCVRLFS